jgi:dihydrolipoamide dehydrogenase
MRTSVPGVYAAGDVTALSMLAHTASRQAEVAINDMLGKDDEMRYDAIPGIVYTNPEVAGVGALKGERELKLPMAYSGRFVAENERGEGLCKIILEGERVTGVHMLGNPCSEIIAAAAIAISRGCTVEDLLKVVFPHPTVGEILKETLASAE